MKNKKYNLDQIDVAKKALDSIIGKARTGFYKPIQIAETLYRDRVYKDICLSDKETYRISSKDWRDAISKELIGNNSTSSSRFQDNVFEENAMPPHLLAILGTENRRTNGAVEAYIYDNYYSKLDRLGFALQYCTTAQKESFHLTQILDSFSKQKGLKRSLDKIYEIIVYSLFATLVEALNLDVEITVDKDAYPLLQEFEDFTQKIMCLDCSTPQHVESGRVYRLGITNQSDRGLDMYSNWGPAIQIKHLSLDESLAEKVVSQITSDRIVIVCKDADRKVILSLLTQIGWRARIQSIVTEKDLNDWYEKALRGSYSNILGDRLLSKMAHEISIEFPSLEKKPDILIKRRYNKISDSRWSVMS